MSSPFDVLDQKYPDIRFELYPNDKAKRVYLTGFIVPYTMRGQGVGSSFMNDLTKIADENGWTITLTPSSSYGGNVTRLRSFYKGFGFVDNKGQNRDFSHREDMYRSPQGADALNEEIEKMRSTLLMLEGKSLGAVNGLNEGVSRYRTDINSETMVKRVPFLKTFNNFSNKEKIMFQKVTYTKDVELYVKDSEPLFFKQFNLSSELHYTVVDMGDNRHRFSLSLVHQTWLMPPDVKDREQELTYRVLTMAMQKQMESFNYRFDEVLEQDALTEEQWDQIINKLNESFFKLENYLEDVLPVRLEPHLEEGNDSLLTEKLTDVDDDVNMLYDMFFKKGVEDIQRTNMISSRTFEQTDVDTSILKNELCVKAHELNPCKIMVNRGNNFYKPGDGIISIAANLQAANFVITQYDGDLNRAVDALEPPQSIMIKKEYTEERIKGSIHHELAHWIDDTFNNQHLKKRIEKNLTLHSAGEALPFDKVTVNAHYMEIQAQIHNVKQLHNKYADTWDTLSFDEMIGMSPSLYNTYRSLPYSLKTQWVKKLKMRMFREGLLGKRMFN